MKFGSFAKFRNFVSSNPPLIVFIFCIGMTAVAFVSFAYYIRSNKIIDPNITRDWNTLLHNATKINFCSSSGNHSNYIGNTTILANRSDYTNVSVNLNIFFSLPYSKLSQSLTSSISAFNGSLLGYSGVFGSKLVHLSFTFQQPLNLTCNNEHGCSHVVDSCLSISAPPNMLPATMRPEQCSFINNDTSSALKIFGSLSDEGSPIQCSNMSMILNHPKDKRLLMYLTETTKSLVHVHLIHSSYFLFLIVLVVLTFGFFRGGDHHDVKDYDDIRFALLSSSSL